MRPLSYLPLAALLLAATTPAVAATSDATFKGYTEALYPSWQRWNNSCPTTTVPTTVTEDSGRRYYDQYVKYMACLQQTVNAVGQRQDAEPLVNAELWKDLSPAQRKSLNEGLKRANEQILAQVTAARKAEDARSQPVIDGMGKVREQAAAAEAAAARAAAEAAAAEEASGASESEVRACARRYEKLLDASDRNQSERADLESAQLQLQMTETRLIGYRATASADNYNRAAQAYNNDVQQLSARFDRYNQKAAAVRNEARAVKDECLSLRYSARVREAVCSGGSYRRFCN